MTIQKRFEFDPNSRFFSGFAEDTAGNELWTGGTAGTALVSAGATVTSGILEFPPNCDVTVWVTASDTLATAGSVYVYTSPIDSETVATKFTLARITQSIHADGTNSAVLLTTGVQTRNIYYCIVADNSTDGTNNMQIYVRFTGKESKTD